jgi:hypothetical protein
MDDLALDGSKPANSEIDMRDERIEGSFFSIFSAGRSRLISSAMIPIGFSFAIVL